MKTILGRADGTAYCSFKGGYERAVARLPENVVSRRRTTEHIWRRAVEWLKRGGEKCDGKCDLVSRAIGGDESGRASSSNE